MTALSPSCVTWAKHYENYCKYLSKNSLARQKRDLIPPPMCFPAKPSSFLNIIPPQDSWASKAEPWCPRTAPAPAGPRALVLKQAHHEGGGGEVTSSSSSSLSSSAWKGKLLQQQSSVCGESPEDKLTPPCFGQCRRQCFGWNSQEKSPLCQKCYSWFRNTPPLTAACQDLGSAPLTPLSFWNKRKNKTKPIIPVFYVASQSMISLGLLWLSYRIYPARIVKLWTEK